MVALSFLLFLLGTNSILAFNHFKYSQKINSLQLGHPKFSRQFNLHVEDSEKNDSPKIATISEDAASSGNMQGFLSSDMKLLGEGKQVRVLIYISLALLPCLLLIPFFMSRDFVPPIDSEMMQ